MRRDVLLPGLMACLAFRLLTPLSASEPTPWMGPVPEPPPPAPPVEARKVASDPLPASFTGLTLYVIGDPSEEEQLFVELINRARANPTLEGQRLRDLTDPDVVGAYTYFGVDLDQMAADMATLSPAPPLSIHPLLTDAARAHSEDMLANSFQGHTGSDGSSPGVRITRAGYTWNTYGENVYASAKSVLYGHAGFEVDWGFGPDGMQSPPGHRLNTHSANYREIGVGVIKGSSGGVGPLVVTQDLARRSGLTPFITGVAYYDFNENGAYDLGEGLGGVEVQVSGSSYYAITTASGGYSVPVPGNTSPTVTFSVSGLPDHTVDVTVASLNVKVDYVPNYSPPVISGPPTSTVGHPNAHQFTAVGGATDYEWEQATRQAFTGVEGAENDLADMTAQVTAGYEVVTTETKASGAKSFHMAHPNAADQLLEWQRVFRLGPSSSLQFMSRLGWATSRQVARVEVSVNGGMSWETIWTRPGTGNGGQNSFSAVNVSLAAYADSPAQFRFVYDFTNGSYYPQTSGGVGWYLDDLTVSGAEELVSPESSTLGGNEGFTFDFMPMVEGDYSLRMRARVGGKLLDWGPPFLTSATATSLALRVDGVPALSGGRVIFDLLITSGAPGNLTVERSSSPRGPWSVDATVTIQTVQAGSRYRVDAAPGAGSAAFYRVRSN